MLKQGLTFEIMSRTDNCRKERYKVIGVIRKLLV